MGEAVKTLNPQQHSSALASKTHRQAVLKQINSKLFLRGKLFPSHAVSKRCAVTDISVQYDNVAVCLIQEAPSELKKDERQLQEQLEVQLYILYIFFKNDSVLGGYLCSTVVAFL